MKQKIITTVIEPDYDVFKEVDNYSGHLKKMLDDGWIIKQISTAPYQFREEKNLGDICLTILLEHE